jgi:hypothetical protein
MGHARGKRTRLVRVYIASGCAWTFWSCGNKVTPLCELVPTTINDPQCRFALLVYPLTHDTHCTYLKIDAPQLKGHTGGPNND